MQGNFGILIKIIYKDPNRMNTIGTFNYINVNIG